MSRFRLAGLLRLRKLTEDSAAAQLAQRSSARRTADRRVEQAERRLGAHTLEAAGGPQVWRASIAARSAFAASADAARIAREQTLAEEEAAQKAYGEAKKNARSLEKLEAKHVEKEKAEDERAEQVVLDELATQRAFRGKDH